MLQQETMMAGDWIKVEKTTPRKPEILHLAELFECHPDQAFGMCFRFWCWCDEQVTNGLLRCVTRKMLDTTIGHEGFADAMIEVGWLLDEEGGLYVPNFDIHLSQCAKKRAQTNRRVVKNRTKRVR